MRTTIRLDDRLLAQAKEFAARNGRTLTAVIEDSLRATLSLRPARGSNRAHVLLPTFRGSGTMPGVHLDDSASLADLMESGDGPA